jgi:hypothetical protein
MSKKCKAASALRRLQKKRALKAANTAKYQSWRNAGENQKSARFTKKKLFGRSATKGTHTVFPFCGNPACPKCFESSDVGVIANRH